MALDHYVSKVHLKQFVDPFPSGRLWAAKKRDLKSFQPWPKDVCRIEQGNTNNFLPEPRYVERILSLVEPAYEHRLSKLRSESVDRGTRETFSAFFAFIITHTPTAIRLLQGPIQAMLKNHARKMSLSGDLPAFDQEPPHPWNGRTVGELIDEGKVEFNVDPKAPQAMATVKFIEIAKFFCSCDWQIISANESTGFFMTSDHPSAILLHDQDKFAWRVFPVSPDRAIVIETITGNNASARSPVTHFVEAKKQIVRSINEKIVRSAEELVFYSKSEDWTMPFLSRNANFRLEMVEVSSGDIIRVQETISPFHCAE